MVLKPRLLPVDNGIEQIITIPRTIIMIIKFELWSVFYCSHLFPLSLQFSSSGHAGPADSKSSTNSFVRGHVAGLKDFQG